MATSPTSNNDIVGLPCDVIHRARDEFTEKGYTLIERFLSDEVCELAYRYGKLRAKRGAWKKDQSAPVTGDGMPEAYGDHLMEVVLEVCQPGIEAVTGRELLPTYSFCRLYHEGAALKAHLDRPACEISATLCLGRDFAEFHQTDPNYDWPMYADGTPCPCPPGSAIIYQGMNVSHWREPLRGREQLQLFLHYVDRDGPHAKSWKYDGRPWLGAPAGAQFREILQQRNSRHGDESPNT